MASPHRCLLAGLAGLGVALLACPDHGLAGGRTGAVAARGAGAPPEAPRAGAGWFAFAPDGPAAEGSAIDLRFLNERFAGEHGFIGVRDGSFVHTRER